MDKKDKDIEKNYKKKIYLLKKYDQEYFDNDNPSVSDKEYDRLKNEVLQLEKKHNFLKNSNSPSKKVGFRPSDRFKKIKHIVPMLSLANAFSKKDIVDFIKKIKNFLSLKDSDNVIFSAEPKIDGISASLKYQNGIFSIGVSRGDGATGEDITNNLKTISNIPKKIKSFNVPSILEVRGEIYISRTDFKKIDKRFSNPRNAAGGSLRQKNPEETKKIPLQFMAYGFGLVKKINFSKQSEYLKLLKEWGFQTSSLAKIVNKIEEIEKNYILIENKREKIDFDIDGLVYKVDDLELQTRLGFVSNAPRWAIAHKFSAEKVFSKIENIEIQVGRTGALTPVAKITPVTIGGVTVSNASLHNEDEINRKDIRIGDRACVQRAGEVIPQVLYVDKTKRGKDVKKFIFPKKCPCGNETIKEFNNTTKKIDAVRRCPDIGYNCKYIAKEKLKHLVSKDAFNIEGLGKKVVENFWNKKFIKYPHDIFEFDTSKLKKVDGWGKLSIQNLNDSIKKSKKISLPKFIYALGIRHIGQENAKVLSKNFNNINKFIDACTNLNKKSSTVADDFDAIDGMGASQIDALKKYFSNKKNIILISKLLKYVNVSEYINVKINSPLSGKSVMFTGKFDKMSRSELKMKAENLGAKIVSSISKRTDFLIVGNTKPTVKKVNQAKSINVKIITEKDLLNILN